MLWCHLVSKTQNTSTTLGGVSGLTASKQATDLNNDKTTAVLCPQLEMKESDGWFYYLLFAVIAESKLQEQIQIEVSLLVAAMLHNCAVPSKSHCTDFRGTSEIFWLAENLATWQVTVMDRPPRQQNLSLVAVTPKSHTCGCTFTDRYSILLSQPEMLEQGLPSFSSCI